MPTITQIAPNVSRKKKGEIQTIDLRDQVACLSATESSLELVAGRGKPMEFARAIMCNDELQADDLRIEKLEVIFFSASQA